MLDTETALDLGPSIVNGHAKAGDTPAAGEQEHVAQLCAQTGFLPSSGLTVYNSLQFNRNCHTLPAPFSFDNGKEHLNPKLDRNDNHCHT